ncbi:MAG: hypothetical protein ACQETI_03860 [Halobacteriota archaeon]
MNTGSWEPLRRCLRNPRILLVDQSEIFAGDDVWPLERLFSHVLIIGVAVPGLYLVDSYLAAFTAVILYAHLLADLYHDTRRHEEYLHHAARYVGEHRSNTDD